MWIFGDQLAWPVESPMLRLADEEGGFTGPQVRLRQLHRRDGRAWRSMRIADEQFLRPVEPTTGGDWGEAHSREMWRLTYRGLARLARAGTLLPAVIEVDGQFAGQLTLGNIQHGIVSNCWIGYWVYSGFRGQGIATAAVALGTDHAMHNIGLHRVEATVMEKNMASRRVLSNTGFRQEGFLQRNLHIDGRWQDHLLVAQTIEESIGLPQFNEHVGPITTRLAVAGRFEILG